MLSENGVGLSAPRVRRFFPETLLWTPQMVTDESGQAQLSVSLADSITTWRLAGSAIARDGRLGSFQQGITVFQDFFIDVQMPVRLTQNDEISIPIGVFNYLNEPQTISLEVTAADWFEFVDNESARSVEAAGNGVQRSSFRIRILKPGRHSVTVRATGTVLSDAVERTVTVIPDGARTEVVTNARLDGDATEIVNIPDHAITGGSDLFVKLYASGFSQVVEGMDSIFQMPHGCFEQTSSTTYPNVLVLNYLRKTEQSNPAIELKALDYIATGYQRLLSYEVDGGGFDWFGRPPANEVLTAYGLHEFTDMAKVYDVDAEMIARTRRWLLGRRESNGTWSGGDLHQAHFHDDSSSDRTLRQTAYIVWALAASGDLSGLNKSIRFLEQNADTRDPYVLAIVANAFIACGREQASQDAVARLSDMAQQDDVSAFWASEGDGLTYSFGASLTVETTALVVQAMISTGTHGQLTTRALDWLTSQRDARGTWHSTQATVQAMRALLMAESGGRVTQDTTIDIMANGRSAKSLTITEDTGDVFHLVSLTESVQSGANTVSLSVSNESRLSYQLVTVYYTPRSAEPVRDNPVLEIDTSYGQRELTVDDLLTVEVTLRYHRPGEAPMTLVDLGIPPGFEVEMESFRNLV
ncbi:MAG: alpha-2-macroglobulin family protein, partial [Planctomycetaceae bacterium]